MLALTLHACHCLFTSHMSTFDLCKYNKSFKASHMGELPYLSERALKHACKHQPASQHATYPRLQKAKVLVRQSYHCTQGMTSVVLKVLKGEFGANKTFWINRPAANVRCYDVRAFTYTAEILT